MFNVALSIQDNWWGFLLVSAGVVGIGIITTLLDIKSSKRSDRLKSIQPLRVLLNILLNQIFFYLNYLFIMFSLDIASFEYFSPIQIFGSSESSFYSQRGLVTALGLAIAFFFSSVALAGVVGTYLDMSDYCFTLWVIHFIVVSIVEEQFPTQGAWWVACAIGLFSLLIGADRLSFYLSTMTYASHLKDKRKSVEMKNRVKPAETKDANAHIKLDKSQEQLEDSVTPQKKEETKDEQKK
jgi:hypothetical protein